MNLEYIVNKNCNYTTVKQILISEFKMSSRLINKLKNTSNIYCNNMPVNIDKVISNGDRIVINLNYPEGSENIIPTEMDLNILYEDEWLLIVNKGPAIPVHPSLNHYTDSLSNGIKHYFNSIGLSKKIRPVNRLDKDTSGIVLFAKNEYIQEALIKQMASGQFQKEYLAIVNGVVNFNTKNVIAPIDRKNNSIIERCISNDGQYAETTFKCISKFDNYSLIECKLKTGRTHQIRVHSKHIGHPILGDTLYGSSSPFIKRQALHAFKIKFIHPVSKENICITCPLPDDMNKLINNKYL